MFNQCETETFETICKATAIVYYEAVKAFDTKKAVEILEAKTAQLASERAELASHGELQDVEI